MTGALLASLAAIVFFGLLLFGGRAGFGVARLPEGLRPIVAGAIGVVFPLIALVVVRLLDDAAVFRPLTAFFTEHRAIGLQVTVTAAAVGFVLFMGGIVHLLLTPGPPEEFTLIELRRALRGRAWWRSSRWVRRLVILAGVALLTFGLFGFGLVMGPPGVKLIVVTALLFAGVQIARGLARARRAP